MHIFNFNNERYAMIFTFNFRLEDNSTSFIHKIMRVT